METDWPNMQPDTFIYVFRLFHAHVLHCNSVAANLVHNVVHLLYNIMIGVRRRFMVFVFGEGSYRIIAAPNPFMYT